MIKKIKQKENLFKRRIRKIWYHVKITELSYVDSSSSSSNNNNNKHCK